MAPASQACFDWRPMSPAPGPDDDVFVRYRIGVLIGNWWGGYLYIHWRGRKVLIIGEALGWSPLEPLLVVSAEDIKVYC